MHETASNETSLHETAPNQTALNETVLKNARPDVDAWLAEFVARNGGFAGSVHLAEPSEPSEPAEPAVPAVPAGEGEIVLVASYNLPVSVRNGTAVIPIGKGMAGTAAQRREPVAVSDFQTDTTGVAVRAGRAAGAMGSLTLPVFGPADDTLVAVVGIGFTERRDFTPEETAKYAEDAATVRMIL
ncbi:GAF domain-containing protein [Streptomyces sp. ID01-12c]|uniref:GAF domain-containing protein n=1 Tax=Streptomyces caniscabiei TaxID=2746961 RepID=UPI001783018D|nr:GAF domain-containing protein [Streptomyces caniscabiei]MBD9701415.1 GAF domain-containing protein [Streptomyces caniscabiei]MDX3725549.1 GAF domain-containing protein [Streptomyces caniscabiei]